MEEGHILVFLVSIWHEYAKDAESALKERHSGQYHVYMTPENVVFKETIDLLYGELLGIGSGMRPSKKTVQLHYVQQKCVDSSNDTGGAGNVSISVEAWINGNSAPEDK